MSERQRIGKYEILEELGRGGFAVVYKARDVELERIIALKVLHPYWTEDPGFAARFRREARSAANLHHAHIITIYDAGEDRGQLYIAMEYLSGHTLRELLKASGALALEQALPILEQIAEALDYAPEQGVIHRDIKPSNVMVDDRRPTKIYTTLMDFGLVKAMESEEGLTSLGTILGSPEYMAPEQADLDRKDEIGPATDRYALGVIVYEMLTGQVPFPGNTPSTLVAHMQKAPPDPQAIRANLPGSVARVLLKALSKSPENRYPSALALVEALAEAGTGAEGKIKAEAEAEARPKRMAQPEARQAPESIQEETKRIAERQAPASVQEKTERIAQAKLEPDAKAKVEKARASTLSKIEAVLPQILRPDSLADYAGQWKLWAWWVLSSGVGMAAGFTVLWILIVTMKVGESLGWALGGGAGGIVGGSLQWLALRRSLKRAEWWIAATTVGGTIGWSIITASDLYVPGIFNLAWAVAVGSVVGGAQCLVLWLVLRQSLAKTGLWIVATVAGLSLAVLMSEATGVTNFESLGWDVAQLLQVNINHDEVKVLGMAVLGFVNGAVSGAVTGIAMSQIANRK
jgi:predicted Ser/Thr protein kinase